MTGKLLRVEEAWAGVGQAGRVAGGWLRDEE